MSRDSRVVTTTYLSTATVTSRIISTQFIIATVTVVASNCPRITTTTPDRIRSAASNRVYTSSTVRTPTNSSLPTALSENRINLSSGVPENRTDVSQTSISTVSDLPSAILSRHGTSSHSGLLGSKAVSSQSSFSIVVTGSNKGLSYVSIATLEASTLISGVSNKHPSVLLPTYHDHPVATMRTTKPTRAASMSHSTGSRSTRAPGFTNGEPDYTLSSRAPLADVTSLTGVTGTTKRS